MSTPLFNPNDNVTGRDGGPYLDEVEARSAESRRAVVEDREPDYDNPPATAGIPLLTGGRVAPVVGVNNLPSQANQFNLSNTKLVEYRANDDEVSNFNARGEIPADFEPASEEGEVVDDGLNSHDPASANHSEVSDEETDYSEVEQEELSFSTDLPFDANQE